MKIMQETWKCIPTLRLLHIKIVRISPKVKGKVCKTVVRPDLLYGLDTVATSKKQEAEQEIGREAKGDKALMV